MGKPYIYKHPWNQCLACGKEYDRQDNDDVGVCFACCEAGEEDKCADIYYCPKCLAVLEPSEEAECGKCGHDYSAGYLTHAQWARLIHKAEVDWSDAVRDGLIRE